MKTLKELRELRAQLIARAEAIVALAREEKRDLSDDEAAEYDSITAEDTGKVAAVDRDILRAERLEALQAEKAKAVAREAPDQGKPQKITVPASARRWTPTKAFRCEEDAYACGQWFAANFLGRENSAVWCQDHGLPIRNVLTGSGAGGVLVPDVFENALINLKEDYSVFQREAMRWPMSSDTAIVPRRSSGATAYYVGEATATTASDATFDNVRLTARTVSVLSLFSKEIASDAVIALANIVAEEIAYAIATAQDAAGFVGDGTSTYGGMVGLIGAIQAGATVTATAGNTSFAELDLADFEKMVGTLPEYPGIRPKWYISKAGWAASMLNLMNAGGGNTNVTLANEASTTSFMGYPVVFCQQMNSTLGAQTSTDGLCYFGDLRMGALFGDRQGVELMSSEHRYMEYRQIGVIGASRFDVNIHGRGTASVAGPIIMLSTPSA